MHAIAGADNVDALVLGPEVQMFEV